ncbi:MAG TPA: hypothetical protein VMS94_07325 [Acidobacteriota bacterium]|jgi:hypothetical protein|nr:hypothetical protein [Acidobacteriota bacterium]
MFGRREEVRKWLSEIIEKFRQKGVVSPDKAMTAEELGLPPIFQEAMKRRLGQSGIFVEVNGKYYLNEARLKEIEGMRQTEGTAWGSRNRMFTLRIVRMIMTVVVVSLLLASAFVQNSELWILAAVFFAAWLVITVLEIYYMSRIRRRFKASQNV